MLRPRMQTTRHSRSMTKKHTKLGQFFATAICGNDILSSALYVSGIAAIFAGMYAPLVLFIVGLVLFLYRSVYREVVEALPVNGGAYNALLNSTSKIAAAVAGTMTILSYVATAVISAKTAVEYGLFFAGVAAQRLGWQSILTFINNLSLPLTVGVLFLFALLVIAGVKDSARVAAGIFSAHIVTLSLFIGVGLYTLIAHGVNFSAANWEATNSLIAQHGDLWHVLFFAFSVSLLGVSGFESSANFVEEQAPEVFRKTLRNMTAGVMVFNPLIAFVCLYILPFSAIVEAKDFLLGVVALKLGGLIFLTLISIDAFLVLSGAVLTAYVGVSGLAYRMALDACLPNFLAKKNRAGSYPRIIILFFLLCVSILFLTHGNLLSLAGVYTISFLSVMTMFAIGNLILRKTRPLLKRPFKASVLTVILAAAATLAGLLGNISVNQKNLQYFLAYFVPTMAIVFCIIFKKDVYKTFSKVFSFIPPLSRWFTLQATIASEAELFVFLHHTNNLYHALDYINTNENGHRITFIHCKRGDVGQRRELERAIPVLHKAGVFPHFEINFLYLEEEFSPALVVRFSTKNKVPMNRIFVGSIHQSHDFEYADLQGVRIILE